MPFLEQYALSVRREPIPVLESVAHMVEFMTMPGAKVKKNKTESAGVYKVNTSPSDVVKILI